MTPAHEKQIPLLSKKSLREFVNGFLKRRLFFSDLVHNFGSPLYVLETAVLKERAQEFKTVMNNRLPDCGFYFAMKSNNLPQVSRVLLDQGLGLDVSSGMELSAALLLDSDQIIFSGPGKTRAELELAVDNSEKVTVLLDSEGELGRLSAIAKDKNRKVHVGVRLNTNPEGLWRKFNIFLDEL